MRKKLLMLLFLCFAVVLSSCGKEQVSPNETSNIMPEVKVSEEVPLVSTQNPTTTSGFFDEGWTFQELDEQTRSDLENAFITSWSSGNWSISQKYAAGDEVLKDIAIFESTKEQFTGYYCLVYASIHIQEAYKNDGSTYYKFSDNSSDKLTDVYMFDTLSTDKSFFAFDLHEIVTDYDEILEKLKVYCGEELISVLTLDERASLIEEANNNDGHKVYTDMQSLLKAGDFFEAQNLYYKTTDLTYSQSRDCLILLTEYELLYQEIGPIQQLITEGGNGKFSLEAYTLNSWQDKDFSDSENDLVIYVEYHCKTSHPIMGNKTYEDYLSIPITLDVDNKSFTKRS